MKKTYIVAVLLSFVLGVVLTGCAPASDNSVPPPADTNAAPAAPAAPDAPAAK